MEANEIGNPETRKEIYRRGMNLLRDSLGIVNAEVFISIVKSEKYDYTEWRREYFDKMTREQYYAEAAEYAKTHPYKGDPSTVS